MHFVPGDFFPQLRENKPGTFDVPRGSLHLAEAQTWRKMNEFLLALVLGHLLLNHMLCIFVKSVPGSITFIQSCRILLEFNSLLFVQCLLMSRNALGTYFTVIAFNFHVIREQMFSHYTENGSISVLHKTLP